MDLNIMSKIKRMNIKIKYFIYYQVLCRIFDDAEELEFTGKQKSQIYSIIQKLYNKYSLL